MRESGQVRFELLGPLRVVEGDSDLTPARPKQRALLTLMLLRRGEVVPGAQLIEAVWGEEPPGSAQTALHGHVSSLRKLLGADRIRTRPPGYALLVSPSEVDVCPLRISSPKRGRPTIPASGRRACARRWRQAEALAAAGADATDPLRAAHAVAEQMRARPLLREVELLADRAQLELVHG